MFFQEKMKIFIGTKKDCGRPYFLCSVKRKEVWVRGRNQHTAKVPSPSRVPKVQILLLPQKSNLQERRSWRAVADCKSVAPGLSWFESHLLHKSKWSFGRLGVCDGLKIRRTWFDSTRFHNKEIHALVTQQLARLPYTQVVAGSIPAKGTTVRDAWRCYQSGLISRRRGFEPHSRNKHVRMPERPKGAICKTVIRRFKSDSSLKKLKNKS